MTPDLASHSPNCRTIPTGGGWVVEVGLILIWSSETRPDTCAHKSVQSLRTAGRKQQPPHRKTPDIAECAEEKKN
ncbi:hypothetical protein TNCV_3396811 [Trichonephila clavipes]|nr:hypothetical protein TNCV_3396811 [Trichonephila clavipes]